MSPTILSVRSQLPLNSNSKISTLETKSSKMSIFHLLAKTNDSSSNLNPTHQHESKGMLSF